MKLSSLERLWAHDVLDTIFPRGSHPRLSTGMADLNLDGFLDDLWDAWPTIGRIGLRAAIVMVALAPLIVLGRPRTFHRLSHHDRLKVLNRLYASRWFPVFGLIVVIKAVGGLVYGSAPVVRDALAPGEPVKLLPLRTTHKDGRAA